MSKQFRLPRPAVASRLRRAAPIAAVLIAALVLVPTASSTSNYTDASGDNKNAGDITGLTVAGDKGSGQLVFRISGANLATSDDNLLFLDIDSDANPLTGNILADGTDFTFAVGGDGYWFARWNGSDWVDTPGLSVTVAGGSSQIIISVNKSELGNTSDINFDAWTVNVSDRSVDSAPDEGAYNYSLDANGPLINSVDVQTTPTAGPKAGKKFVVQPTALHLPPDARQTPANPAPDSYSCTAKLGAKKLVGTATGACTFSIPKKKSKGKTLSVQLTVNYQGAAKVVPLTFKVR
jgi:hypothetical protein